MSLLRQRFVSQDKPRHGTKDKDSTQQDHTAPAGNTRSLRAFLQYGFVVLSSLVGYFLLTTQTTSEVPDLLPSSYALCSRNSKSIYTVDPLNSKAQCLVVRDSRIVDIGSIKDVKRRWNENSALQVRYIPDGSIIIPGMSDSHAHILEYGASKELPLEGTRSIQDTVKRVREYILSNPTVYNNTSKFIFGGGWDHTIWPTVGWPTSVCGSLPAITLANLFNELSLSTQADLDADPIIRGRPVVLQSKDCHALWVSSSAIEASLPFPEDVDGGIIIRDVTGTPTGVLLDNAQDLLKQPELTEDDLLRRFRIAVKDAHAYGLTSIHDAGLDPTSLAFFRRQAEAGELPIRIYGMTYFNEEEKYWGNVTTQVIGAGNGRLSARSVKIFADGALRTGGAALNEPYHDNPSTNGFMRLDPEVLFDVIPKFLMDGWQVNVHAIGDRANSIVIDAFEASLKGANVSALRPRLEHAQFMTKRDMQRLGKLGVIASVQPTHAISDMWYAENRLGPERVKGLYAFRSLIDSGARIALGSDFPVESMNPLSGFYAAITRLSPDGKSPHGSEGWFPEERLTRVEALRGMTIDAAYASFTEDSLGSLEIGKRADYVILSQDIMTVPTNKILATKSILTAIDGKPVYGTLL